MKSFAETPIDAQSKVYERREVKHVLGVKEGDVLEWFLDNGRIIVKKKEG